MTTLASLRLPIVLAAVIVFIASSVIHMAPLWHRSDYRGSPQEAEFMNSLRLLALAPGDYLIPWSSHQEMRSPAFQEKMKQGPVGLLTVLPNGRS